MRGVITLRCDIEDTCMVINARDVYGIGQLVCR